MKDIYVFGSLNMDLVINSPYIPAKGETLLGSGFITSPGGKGANQAVACSNLGGNVYMAGCVGDDIFGNKLIDNLTKYGVKTEYVRKVNDTTTGVAVIIITKGDNRIILDAGANYHVNKEDVDNLLKNAQKKDIFMTQLENPIDIVGYSLKKAKQKGMFVILNPAPANKACLDYFEYIDLLTPNESELKLLTGKKNILAGCKVLLEKGINELVVTLGDKGYLYYSKAKTFYGKAKKVKVVDTTGAGDTFSGALGVELAKGSNIEYALEFASYASAISVTRVGAQSSIPTREEVNNFIQNINY